MYRSESRSQDDQRSWQGNDDRSQSEGSGRSMQPAQNEPAQQGSQSWTGYVVPYRYFGPGYRGVGYYSVMYLGPNRGEGESRGEFDQRNVDYGQGQGAGAAWSGGRGSGMSGGYAGRGPKGYQRSDQRIEEEINDRLMADDRIDASEVQVKVKNGEVTLTGTVDDREAKRRAEDLAESVMGVEDVMNQLKVTTSRSQWSGSGSGSSQGSQSSRSSSGTSTSSSTASSSNRRSTSRNGGRSSDEPTSSTSSSR
jgi:osmotically-inducible protein OsmY